MELHRYVDHQRLHIVTKDVISLSISVLLLFRHYISHKITFGAPSSGGVLCSACGAFILYRNIFPRLKIRYVPSADFFEIRNTVTDIFAFCGGTLIVAMVTLQEPYFPKHVFSYINSGNFVIFLEYAGIFVTDRTQYENVL